MPFLAMIHCSASARAVNMMGADRRPNGRTLSAMTWPPHRRWRSSGWTGTIACLMSAFAMRVPFPNCSMMWSILMYVMLHDSLSIPSLTLAFAGDERSTIRRHFPGLANHPEGTDVALDGWELCTGDAGQ